MSLIIILWIMKGLIKKAETPILQLAGGFFA